MKGKTMKSTIKITIFTMVMVAIIMGAGYFSNPNVYAQADGSIPFSGIVIEPQGATPFKLTATIMEINQGDNPNIVVAEKIILITEYKYLNEIQSTELIDKYGNAIEISDLELGQRVIVDGLELSDEIIVGEQIQVKPKK